MAAATAAAPAAVPPAPLASASLYVGDLDAGITEPQVISQYFLLVSKFLTYLYDSCLKSSPSLAPLLLSGCAVTL